MTDEHRADREHPAARADRVGRRARPAGGVAAPARLARPAHGRGAARAARLRGGHPGQGQRQGRPVRRRAAGRPDPVHQQPVAGLAARGERDRRASSRRGTPCRATPGRAVRRSSAPSSRPTPSASSPARVPVVGSGVSVTVADPKGGVGSNQLLEGARGAPGRRCRGDRAERPGPRAWHQTSLKDVDGGVIVDGQLIKAPYRHRGDRQPARPRHRARLQGRLRRRGAASRGRRQA